MSSGIRFDFAYRARLAGEQLLAHRVEAHRLGVGAGCFVRFARSLGTELEELDDDACERQQMGGCTARGQRRPIEPLQDLESIRGSRRIGFCGARGGAGGAFAACTALFGFQHAAASWGIEPLQQRLRVLRAIARLHLGLDRLEHELRRKGLSGRDLERLRHPTGEQPGCGAVT